MVHISKPRGVAGSTNSSAEVLLVHDVEHLGKRGEIVKVKPGYARNYLLPHGVATVASDENKRMVELHKEKLKAIESSRIREFVKIADAVNKYSATIEANATTDNALYGSVGPKDISDALKAAGHKIEPEHVRMEGPIRELGMYTVKLKLHEKVQTDVKVWVVPSAAGV
ncbi:50S ribosomal protein L9 [Fuerstiella marisgermanici]|uniref:Large ribosomal subunit protein bL9 n=1 Tax=Fuerstiella marisgermanici TaxID=1891926 RepID=A0A1P8WK60_9PLAN|nr:50S ribosomal protein L9 [Fuerstiella marisgermanici]APZ94432.1 50S ribosomal protein L9 [Fuerstiella marisgermanici]